MTNEQQTALLALAKGSIRHGLDFGQPLKVDMSAYDSELVKDKASFVTLKIDDALRGCIGSLMAHRPLVVDVAENAFSAAFRDPRFSPLQDNEFNQLHYHISVLSEPELLLGESEQDLIDKLRPGEDGLILSLGSKRSTFLPSVWEQLPAKPDFLGHLKRKAGLPGDFWTDDIQVERYSVESFESL